MGKLAALGLIAAMVVCGCSAPIPPSSYSVASQAVGYSEPPALTTSLFKSDQAVLDDESVDRILSSPSVLPPSFKVALMKFPEPRGWGLRYYGSDYWRTEDYLKTQQSYIDTISGRLTDSDRVSEVVVLPSLLTPNEVTIPVLREAAVRLQTHALVIFRITSDIYHRPKFFAQDQVKAYCTCEVVLLHVQTGVIPFTKIVTMEQSATKEKSDLDINETMRRAETAAVLASLKTVSDDLAAFLAKAR
ncbi:MAG: hypothetical protein ACM3VT_20030 [Solirubrobacterales bacterium]